MNAKFNIWIVAALAALFVSAWFVFPVQGSTALPDAPVANSCFTCHEDLYYLHDTGKSYCITEHKDRCVNCHEGDPATLNKDASHLGLVAHPQKNSGEKCLECHPQDSTARLAKFASLGGYKEVNAPAAYVPAQPVALGAPEVAETDGLLDRLPWAVGGVIVFAFWLALVLHSPLKP